MIAYDLRRASRGPLTLLDMLRLFASDWNEMLRQLEALSNLLNPTTLTAFIDGPKDLVLEPLRKIERLCRYLKLTLSETYGARLVESVERTQTMAEEVRDLRVNPRRAKSGPLGSSPPEGLSQRVAILRERIDDELRQVELFVLEPGEGAYLADPYLFGPEVADKFRSATADIEEAGKCFAFDRHTACVFHLMRVMEVALRALATTLNDPRLDPKRNPSWESILRKCREELAKPLQERSPEWRADDVFFSGAAAMLMAVKDAWRNPTMHVEMNYDEERAVEVWNSVRAFLRHLATKLHE